MARNIKQALEHESSKKADLGKAIIRRYLGNGIWLLKQLGCNTLFRATGQGSISYPPNMSVNYGAIQGSFQRSILSLPPPGRRGASAYPVATLGGGALDALALRQAVPSTVPRGVTGYAIELRGAGFLESPIDAVSVIIYNPITGAKEPDPYVEIDSVTFISTEQLDITLSVSEDTPSVIGGYKPIFRIKRS